MRVTWALICRHAITNRDSNNISLIEVIDELTVAGPPPQSDLQVGEASNVLIDLQLVVLWSRSDPNISEKSPTRVKAVGPYGAEALTVERIVDLTEFSRMRMLAHLLGAPIPFAQQGQYLFNIEVQTCDSQWEEVFQVPLWVNVQTDDPTD